MTDAPTDSEILAECEKAWRGYPVGMSPLAAIILYQQKKRELATKPKLKLVKSDGAQ
jgi:hypothetical protein